jgi:ribonuclease Z
VALTLQVLGTPDTDNALFVKVDTGQAQSRLLFDCGDGCPHALGAAELREVDHLCFSHLHMDHVSGFDLFFRITFDRADRDNRIWVPHGSGEIVAHRFRGFLWNLVGPNQKGEWLVHEIAPARVETRAYFAREAFRTAHERPAWPRRDRTIIDGDGFTVEALLLDHGTPSVGYVVREAARVNVDTEKLYAKGFKPGPWLKRLRGAPAAPGETVEVNGAAHDLNALQGELLVTTPGDSVAYLTDFRCTPAALEELAPVLAGVGTVVSECQFRASDGDLANDVMHSTSREVAELAARANVGKLVLFHFSARYTAEERAAMLAEAREVFARAEFPAGW